MTVSPRWLRRWRRLRESVSISPSPAGGEGEGLQALISALAIDNVFQRAARLETRDLARDIVGDRVGVGVGRVVRGEHDLRMCPEWTIRRQWLLGEHIERG